MKLSLADQKGTVNPVPVARVLCISIDFSCCTEQFTIGASYANSTVRKYVLLRLRLLHIVCLSKFIFILVITITES